MEGSVAPGLGTLIAAVGELVTVHVVCGVVVVSYETTQLQVTAGLPLAKSFVILSAWVR